MCRRIRTHSVIPHFLTLVPVEVSSKTHKYISYVYKTVRSRNPKAPCRVIRFSFFRKINQISKKCEQKKPNLFSHPSVFVPLPPLRFHSKTIKIYLRFIKQCDAESQKHHIALCVLAFGGKLIKLAN